MFKTHHALVGGLLLGCSAASFADNLEGKITSVNRAAKTLTVQGQTFYVNSSTNFDDNLGSFRGLKVGQRVDVDYDRRNGKRYASEIEAKSSNDDGKQRSYSDDRDDRDDRDD